MQLFTFITSPEKSLTFECIHYISCIHKNFIFIFPLEYAYLASDSNYCRIADEPDPWCYTTDAGTRWDWCSIPYCCELNPKNKAKINIIVTCKA